MAQSRNGGVVFNEGGGLAWKQFRFVCASSVTILWNFGRKLANVLQADINGDGNNLSLTEPTWGRAGTDLGRGASCGLAMQVLLQPGPIYVVNP
jgi:hypothetical protein